MELAGQDDSTIDNNPDSLGKYTPAPHDDHVIDSLHLSPGTFAIVAIVSAILIGGTILQLKCPPCCKNSGRTDGYVPVNEV